MNKPRGTQDILPSEVHKWHHVESTFRDVCRRFGYKEIRTPLFEYTNLFKRGVVGNNRRSKQRNVHSFQLERVHELHCKA